MQNDDKIPDFLKLYSLNSQQILSIKVGLTFVFWKKSQGRLKGVVNIQHVFR